MAKRHKFKSLQKLHKHFIGKEKEVGSLACPNTKFCKKRFSEGHICEKGVCKDPELTCQKNHNECTAEELCIKGRCVNVPDVSTSLR